MLDATDRRLLSLLALDARRSLKDLAHEVGLSSPSVSERIRRLQEKGIVRGFTVDIDPKALGFSVQALVRIRPLPGKSQSVQALLEKTPEVAECDKVTGDDCYVARVFVGSIDQLDEVLARVVNMAETTTSIVKSQPVRRRPGLL